MKRGRKKGETFEGISVFERRTVNKIAGMVETIRESSVSELTTLLHEVGGVQILLTVRKY